MNPKGSEQDEDSKMSTTTRHSSARPWWVLSTSYFTGLMLFLWWAKSGAGMWIGILVVFSVFLVTGSLSIILAHRERKKFGYFRVPEDSPENSQADLASGNDQVMSTNSGKPDAEIHSLDDQRVELRQITAEINTQEDQLHTGTGN